MGILPNQFYPDNSNTDNLTNLNISLSALRDAITAVAPNNKTLADIVTAITNLSSTLISTLAKESGGNLATIAGKKFATETTLELIRKSVV